MTNLNNNEILKPQPTRPMLAEALVSLILHGSKMEKIIRVISKILRRLNKLFIGKDEVGLAIKNAKANNIVEYYRQEVLASKYKDICIKASTPPKWAGLLVEIVKLRNHVNILELGTNLGVGTKALSLNNTNKVKTVELQKEYVDFVKEKQPNIEVVNNVFLDFLTHNDTIYDIVFIDGHHSGYWLLRYLELIPRKGNMIIVIDDINWSWDMKRAWKKITQTFKAHTIYDMYKWGIIITNTMSKRYNIYL